MAERREAADAGITEKAKARVTDVKETAVETVETVRGKTGNLQATLADKLEDGADVVRERTGRGPRSAVATRRRSGRIPEVGEAVAGRLERTAIWLRENDLTDFAGMLGQQLRERPARIALIALSLGFILGRASRR